MKNQITTHSGKTITIHTDRKACSNFRCSPGDKFLTRDSTFLRKNARKKYGKVLGVNHQGVWVKLENLPGPVCFGLAPFIFLIEKENRY